MVKCSNPRCQETASDPNSRCRNCHALFLGALVRDRYQVERMVGKGGFGITYLVRDQDCFGEARILKELSPNSLSQDNTSNEQAKLGENVTVTAERLFQREARMLLNLQHPGIPKLHAYFNAGNFSYLVQDWIPGKTLSEEFKARKTPYTEPEVCAMLVELAEILEYLHSHTPPVIHRDIKPQNLMRHANGKILLIDFGAVYQAAGVKNIASRTLIGSPGYAPIEQTWGEPVPQSDLYAAGATMLYLLSGIHPSKLFNHANKRMEWEAHVQVSWALADLLSDLLVVELTRRLKSASELKHRLVKLLNQLPQKRSDAVAIAVPEQLTNEASDYYHSDKNPISDSKETPTQTRKQATPIDKPVVDNWTARINSPESAETADSQFNPTLEQPPDEVGMLAQMPFPFLLRRIYRERLNGRLTCTLDGVTKTLYFEEGTLVFAKSSLKVDRLGERLISIGRITSNDFDKATTIMKSRGIKFGAALIRLDCITPEELKPLMSEQFSNITYSLFDWSGGDYQIRREAARQRSIKVSLSTADIIFEGLRRMHNIELIKRWLGDFSWKLTMTSDPFLLYQSVSLNPREAFIVSRIESSMSVDEILSIGGMPEDETLKTLCGLLTVGMLDWAKEGQRSMRSAQPISSLLANQQSPDDLQSAAAFCYEVEKLLNNLDSLNYYGLLGVARNAGEEELRHAYSQLAKKFHPDRHTQLAKYNLNLRSDLEQIFKKISEIYYFLSDPIARKQYDRNSRTTGTYRVSDDNLTQTPINRATTKTPVHPSRNTINIANNQNDQESTKSRELNQPVSGAQLNFEKGMKYYQAFQFKQAYFAFNAAVTEMPQKAEYHIFLARTLAQLQGHYNQAKDEFIKAIELEPNNADYYAELGLFYQRLNMLKQAGKMFEKSLELVPNHPIARRAMKNLT